MPRYIDADKLKKHYSWWKFEDELNHQKEVFDQIIDLQPTADVQKVKHGKWIQQVAFRVKCSFCGVEIKAEEIGGTIQLGKYKFCPICGERMDGGKK